MAADFKRYRTRAAAFARPRPEDWSPVYNELCRARIQHHKILDRWTERMVLMRCFGSEVSSVCWQNGSKVNGPIQVLTEHLRPLPHSSQLQIVADMIVGQGVDHGKKTTAVT